MAAAGVIADFELPEHLEAGEPPEARGLRRDEVRLLVSDVTSDTIEHARFHDLPRWLSPGDLLVVNTSATLNAALPASTDDGESVRASSLDAVARRFLDRRGAAARTEGVAAVRPTAARARRTGCQPAGRATLARAVSAGRFAGVAFSPVDRRTSTLPAPVDRLSCRPRLSDSIQLREALLARVDVSDRFRDRTRQRRDAVGRPTVYDGAGDAARLRRHSGRPARPAHRRRESGEPRTAVRGVLPCTSRDRGACQRRETMAATASSPSARQWSGPSKQ